MNRRTLLLAALAVPAESLSTGCGTSHEVGGVQRRLVERCVERLTEEDITTAAQRACRYRGPADLPWHQAMVPLFALVYNDAVPENRSSAVGWAQECP